MGSGGGNKGWPEQECYASWSVLGACPSRETCEYDTATSMVTQTRTTCPQVLARMFETFCSSKGFMSLVSNSTFVPTQDSVSADSVTTRHPHLWRMAPPREPTRCDGDSPLFLCSNAGRPGNLVLHVPSFHQCIGKPTCLSVCLKQ